MSRRRILALAAALAVALVLPTSRAQAQILGTGGADPFSLYFGYYIPHQAAIAAQPNALDTINQITAARGYAAVTDRAGLYDPISPYGDEDLDPLRPVGSRRGGEKLAHPQLNPGATSNARGTGPAMFYNRTARYYPQIRTGRGSNRNLAVTRTRGAGMAMPSLPGVR
jgi:hypothetical protein